MKIVLVGDTQVGKTCLVKRLTSGTYTDNNPATIGAAFQNCIIQTEHGNVSLQIWDTAGQEKFRALAPMYYRSASVAILCFDLTNPTSFNGLEQWAMELTEKASYTLKLVVVGNKKDLIDERKVAFEAANDFAMKHGAIFYTETSAKTGESISELFYKIASHGQIESVYSPPPLEPAKPKESGGCC
ncbi:small GTP-binding protein, putative [Trichomonas vaginalis G3]|uniref:Small GTP-binding protein, putative n=2 Tax=Trichomonas vaginalis TaxID=5722 RepID=A0A8U0WQ11_TRIV3|nr:small Rab GTPase RabC7 [Trichomonas vaginalis G3]AAY83822.1 small Rab GTPase RabC7 [Trichomonas vaginalis]EAY14713.1 small GTP-binding protein, putative [Trichomonas vaginalis G3]KAI5487916.1 small Rab GTPase RabC7 [Trichomonas vaginalis G3]|eukprot:XP_001326936.1 small GTP-binding protein [Trichomonas vaginalis G3]